MHFILNFNSGWVSIPYFLLSLLSMTLDNSCFSSTSRVESRIRSALQLRPHPYPVKKKIAVYCILTQHLYEYSPQWQFPFFATTLPIHSYSCVIHPNRQMLFCSAIAKLFPACTHVFYFLSFVLNFILLILHWVLILSPEVCATLDSFGSMDLVPSLSFLALSSPMAPCLSSYRPAGKLRAGEEEHTSSLTQV